MIARRSIFIQIGALMTCLFFISGLSGCGFFSSASTDYGPPPAKAHKVVKTAYTQMGKKYTPGGASPHKGFDCSGLVWWAYKQNGVKVPRITVDQAKTGKGVLKKQARSGDIMVFKVGNSPRGLHTGLYVGDGCFIHSPSRGKRVCVERLSPYWHKKLVAVRRVTRK